MFNPVGAIIQAILMIYDTVMFFIENINRILDFVEAVISSFYKIATGAIGEAANWIEKALANTIPIIISFLARLLGIGGITDKIVTTIKKLQARVDKAIDKVMDKIVAGVKKLGGTGRAGDKARAADGREKDPRSPEEKKRDLDRAAAELRPRIEPLLARGVPRSRLQEQFKVWKKQYRLNELELAGGKIRAVINPQIDMFNADEQLVGERLERILRDAEAISLADVETTPDSADRMERARNAVRNGKLLPLRMTQDEMVVLIRELPTLRSGKFVVQAPGYRLKVSADGRLMVEGVGAYVYRHLPGMAPKTQAPIGSGGYYQPGGSSYLWTGKNVCVNLTPLNNPTLRGLRDQVEVARATGTLPANRVSRALVDLNALGAPGKIRVIAQVMVAGAANIVSEDEITFGRMAPMAAPSSAQAGTGAEAASPSEATESATGVRHGTFAVIFETLSRAIKQIKKGDPLLSTPRGSALAKVAEAYDHWRSIAFRNGKALRRGSRIQAAEMALRDALLRLMEVMRT
jgi:hypothetical protein